MKKIWIVLVVALLTVSTVLAIKLFKDSKPKLSKIDSDQLSIEFKSFSAEISSHQRFQFAELRQNELLTQKSEKKIFWEKFKLPDVVVELEVPVEYTFFVDLQRPWKFRVDGDVLKVRCPEIEYNSPSADISQLKLTTKEGSLFRDENEVMTELRSRLSEILEEKAHQNIDVVRETGRSEIKSFVLNWLSSNFAIDDELSVEVVFEDEDSDINFD